MEKMTRNVMSVSRIPVRRGVKAEEKGKGRNKTKMGKDESKQKVNKSIRFRKFQGEEVRGQLRKENRRKRNG